MGICASTQALGLLCSYASALLCAAAVDAAQAIRTQMTSKKLCKMIGKMTIGEAGEPLLGLSHLKSLGKVHIKVNINQARFNLDSMDINSQCLDSMVLNSKCLESGNQCMDMANSLVSDNQCLDMDNKCHNLDSMVINSLSLAMDSNKCIQTVNSNNDSK
jgi:hypothetical protein